MSGVDLIDEYKKSRLQRTFDTVAQMLVVFFLGLLIYYNGLMLLPHVTPLFWAVLWSIFLHKPLMWVMTALAWIDKKTESSKMYIYVSSTVIFASVFFVDASLLTVIITTVGFSLWTFLLWGDRTTVAVVVLLFGGTLVLGLPMYVFIKSCVEESQAIATKIRDFVEKNPQFQTLLDDFGNSPYYRWLHDYAGSWGVEVPAWDPTLIKDKIIAFSMQFSSHFTDALGGVLGLLSDSVRMLVSFVTFISALFYLLRASVDINALFRDLSPLSREDSRLLMASLSGSVVSVFLSSFLVGLSHGVGTYLVFWFTGVELGLILSFIAAFTSMLPVVGSYVVWVPVALALGLSGEQFKCVLVVTVQLMLQFPVDSLIYSLIPGNSFLVSFSLAMACYVFGTIGVILGPLLAGLCVPICELYRLYQGRPELYTLAAPEHLLARSPTVSRAIMSNSPFTSTAFAREVSAALEDSKLRRERPVKTEEEVAKPTSVPLRQPASPVSTTRALQPVPETPKQPGQSTLQSRFCDKVACEVMSPGLRRRTVAPTEKGKVDVFDINNFVPEREPPKYYEADNHTPLWLRTPTTSK